VFFLFTALPEDYVEAFCTSAPYRAVVPCDSTAFLLLYLLLVCVALHYSLAAVRANFLWSSRRQFYHIMAALRTCVADADIIFFPVVSFFFLFLFLA